MGSHDGVVSGLAEAEDHKRGKLRATSPSLDLMSLATVVNSYTS
jgi:hypothetical protein